MSGKWDVEDWITEVATLPVTFFYPSAVATDTALPLDEVFQYLLEAVNQKKLNLLWEIRCPGYSCRRSILTSANESFSKFISCPGCVEELEVIDQNIYPVFEITEAYRERAKKKQELSKTRLFGAAKSLVQHLSLYRPI